MDVLVDLDGTLVDPKPGLIGSIQYALDKLGRPVPPAEELLRLIGPPFRVIVPQAARHSDRPSRPSPTTANAISAAACTTPSSTTACPPRWTRSPPPAAGCSSPPPSRTTTHARSWSISISPGTSPASTAPSSTAPTTTRQISSHTSSRSMAWRPGGAVMIGDREFDVIAAKRNGIPYGRRHLGLRHPGGVEAAGAASLCHGRPISAAVLALLRSRNKCLPYCAYCAIDASQMLRCCARLGPSRSNCRIGGATGKSAMCGKCLERPCIP